MQQNNAYDIAIIGGGLAGLSLAIQAADAGYKVVLFEKEEYPFHKVCGEYISNESLPFLLRLGVPLTAYNLPQIKTLNITDAAGRLYSFSLDLGGFGISRFLLDDLLYKLALQKGVKIFTQTKVQDVQFADNLFSIASSAGDFTSYIACGTYGKRGNLDVKWRRSFVTQKQKKLNNFIGVKYHIRYAQQADIIALHNFKNGYCGISKIENDDCCLCYLTTAKNLKKHNNNIAQMEQELLSQNPHLKRIFSEAEFLYKQPLVISQVSFLQKTQIENHVLMLGDTAGLITPLCGNGMSMAMHSAVIAFKNIDNFLQGNCTRELLEKQYETQWKKQFAKRLFAGRLIQGVFGGNTATAFFLKSINVLRPLAKAIIKATHGQPF